MTRTRMHSTQTRFMLYSRLSSCASRDAAPTGTCFCSVFVNDVKNPSLPVIKHTHTHHYNTTFQPSATELFQSWPLPSCRTLCRRTSHMHRHRLFLQNCQRPVSSSVPAPVSCTANTVIITLQLIFFYLHHTCAPFPRKSMSSSSGSEFSQWCSGNSAGLAINCSCNFLHCLYSGNNLWGHIFQVWGGNSKGM